MRNAVGGVQSALVLGAGSDIARATVAQLVERGCERLALAVRRPEELTGWADELRARGVAVEVLDFDAGDTAAHATLTKRATAALGDIDLALVAFGVLGDQEAFDADPDAAVDAIHVNYTGAVSVCLRLAEVMRSQGHGAIVVLSSVAGERVRRSNYVYGSSKAGLDGFAQGLGDALAPAGVQVVVVRPGFVHTKMTDGLPAAPFSTTPEAVAADIVAGLERGRLVVWSPRILRVVMSVLRHLPRAVFRRLPL